jgi:hypothetical protein
VEPALLLIGKVALGVALTAPMAARAWRRRRAQRAIPRVTIGAAPEGVPVRVVGEVVAAAPGLRGPMTGRWCARYELFIEERVGQQWVWIAREVEVGELIIDDGSGCAIVDLTHAEISDEVGVRVGRTTADEPTIAAVLARAQRTPHGPLRWRERAFEVGTPVAVLGVAVREPDPDAVRQVTGYRAGPPTRLHFTGSARRPVVVSDDPALADAPPA